MIDDPSETAYQSGLLEGKRAGELAGKRARLVKEVFIFLLAAAFAFAAEVGTYKAGVKHGIALTVGSDYLRRAIKYGYTQGVNAQLENR